MRSVLLGSRAERRADRLAAGLTEMAALAQELAREAGAEIGATVSETRSRLLDAVPAVTETAQQAARATHTYVRENPWKVLGIAAAVGAVVAILLTRR